MHEETVLKDTKAMPAYASVVINSVRYYAMQHARMQD